MLEIQDKKDYLWLGINQNQKELTKTKKNYWDPMF